MIKRQAGCKKRLALAKYRKSRYNVRTSRLRDSAQDRNMKKKPLIVPETAIGQRFDVWLSVELGQTRSQLQKSIKSGAITLDGKKVSPHYSLKGGEAVVVGEAPVIEQTADEALLPVKELTEIPVIRVVAETPEYVVIEKPSGLVMHPATGVIGITLVDWLLKKYPKIKKVGDDPARPGIVHRLDREVSGLVVIAKTQKAFDDLKEQFMDRRVRKCYHALVHGVIAKDAGDINFRIERSAQGFKMAAKPENQSGLNAATEFEVEKRFVNYTYLKVEIKTGRTHQIRAHLSAYGNPVVGDDLYAGAKLRVLNKKLQLGRIFLAATDLEFFDLAGEKQKFSLPIPPVLQKMLDTLT